MLILPEAQMFGACIQIQTEATTSSKLGRKFHRISDDAISQGLLTILSNACSSTIPPGQRSREGVMNPTLSMKRGWRDFCHLSGLPADVYHWIQKPWLEPGPNQSRTTWHSVPKFHPELSTWPPLHNVTKEKNVISTSLSPKKDGCQSSSLRGCK